MTARCDDRFHPRRPAFTRGSGSAAAAGVAVLVAVGCGRAPELYPVSGSVVFNGEPVAGAGVLFCRAGARPAGATTDDKGVFLLRTLHDGDGTLAGEHTVCISKFVPLSGNDAAAYGEMRNTLPERYASPVTSPLRAIVSPRGDNRFRFDLEKGAK